MVGLGGLIRAAVLGGLWGFQGFQAVWMPARFGGLGGFWEFRTLPSGKEG